jgi:hypothetical protein
VAGFKAITKELGPQSVYATGRWWTGFMEFPSTNKLWLNKTMRSSTIDCTPL